MTGQRDTLIPKQERFVQEYLLDVNATQAAIRAGYSKKTAMGKAARSLTNVTVSEAIAKEKALLAEQANVPPENVVAELALKGHRSLGGRRIVGEMVTNVMKVFPPCRWRGYLIGAPATVC
jgi:phage terminase small subunit